MFYPEIDEWLHPDMLVIDVPDQASYRPLVEIFAAGSQTTFSTYLRNAEAVFKLNFSVTVPDGTESWLVGSDPYTAKVTGKQLQGPSSDWLPSTFIGLMFELHYALLLPNDISRLVVGVSGALLIISTLTGLIVWWPLTGCWRQALIFKTKAGKVRFNYDLYKVSGFYTALVMIPVLFSGVYMVLPYNVVPVLELFSPVTYRYWFQSTPPAENASAIGMDQAVAIAKQRYPTGRLHWIYGAPESKQTYTVCQDGVDAPSSILKRRCTVINRYSGKVLDLDDPSLETATAGEIFTHWQWPLHSGQAFGMAGRILVFLTGLACPALFITGVIRWLQKRQARLAMRR